MNGTTDAEWNEYLDKLEAYGLSDYLAIMQKYLDAYYAKAISFTRRDPQAIQF